MLTNRRPGGLFVVTAVAVIWAVGVTGARAGTVVEVSTNWDTEIAAENPNFQKLRIELRDDGPGDPINTANNFLDYVLLGGYDNTLTHRWVDGFVAQGGGYKMIYEAGQPQFNFAYVAPDDDPMYDWGYYPDTSTGDPTVGWGDPNYFDEQNLLDYDPTGENQNFEAWFFRNIAVNANENPDYGPIPNEFDSQTMTNTIGTLSMAKLGGDPDSATNEFFVNMGDNSANLDNQNGGFTVFADVVTDATKFTGLDIYQWFSDHLVGIVNLSPDGYFPDGSQSPYDTFDGYRDDGPFDEMPLIGVDDGAGNVTRYDPLIITSMQVISTSSYNPLPGDFNGDGVVEAADLALLLDNWGGSDRPDGWAVNHWDGFVDANELSALLDNWGLGLGSDPLDASALNALVPEPGTIGLMLFASILYRRRR